MKLPFRFSPGIFLLLAIIYNCSGGSVRFGSIPENPLSWNEFAGFLSGNSENRENPFAASVGFQSHDSHRTYMNQAWRQLEQNTLHKMGIWEKEHIPRNRSRNTVFYPLSGADLINVYSLFPRSRRYILAGLEKTGDPSVIHEAMNRSSLQGSLAEIRSLMGFYTRYSYFTSKGMSEHMQGHKVHGVLPIFLIALSRLGMEIKTVSGATLTHDGQLEVDNSPNPPVLYIRFYSPREKQMKELIYLNFFLSNESLSSNQPHGKLVLAEKNLNLMLKSAVYLFHNPKYSVARDFLLQKADFILQDDSGIPWRNLDRSKWQANIYGIFTTPVLLSGIVPANPVQPDLAQVYKTEAQPLPFEYGYGNLRGRGKSNLLTADRK